MPSSVMLRMTTSPANQEMGSRASIRASLATLVLLAATHARADPISDFYSTITLRLIIATDAGDGYDGIGRLVARHLPGHIPGNPKIVIENMGGASGRTGANYAYNLAPRDGSAILAMLQTTPIGQTLGEPGIRYDASKFQFIGSPLTPVDVFAVLSSSGAHTMDDARHIEVSIGSTSATAQNYIYPKLANELLGARFRIVTGYSGGNAINLAMERGEIQGRAAFPWLLLKATRPDWLREGKVSLLAHTSLEKRADLPDVPRLIDLAPDAAARAVFAMMGQTTEVGRPYVAPPGAPPERVAALRRAFDAMVHNPAFIADAETMQEEVEPKSGEDLQKIVADIVATPAETIARFRAALANNVQR